MKPSKCYRPYPKTAMMSICTTKSEADIPADLSNPGKEIKKGSDPPEIPKVAASEIGPAQTNAMLKHAGVVALGSRGRHRGLHTST